ncbi:MAG: electron transport complex subunit RsxG [Cellvibrio sp.]|jgi:electron transport complex protein RnfG|nr:electron transport complex subunit RsxG [Cellvibrio sp.]
MLGQSISRNSIILGVFALLAAAGLALTNLATQDRISKAERAAKQKALFEIISADQLDNDLLQDIIEIPASTHEQLGVDTKQVIYIARRQGQVTALIIPAMAHDGYSGDISMIVGVNRNLTIAGVRVIAHKETPGLGDKIEIKKSQWIVNFNGKSLQAPITSEWLVKKDGGVFDQFAGATISPRAMVKKIREVLEFAQAHPELFDTPVQTGEHHE